MQHLQPFQEFRNSDQLLPYLRILNQDPNIHIFPCLVNDITPGIAIHAYGVEHRHVYPFNSEDLALWTRDVLYEDMRRVYEWTLDPLPEVAL